MILAHQVSVGLGEAVVVAVGVVVWSAVTFSYHRGWRLSGRPFLPIVAFAGGLAAVLSVVSPPLEHLAEDLVSVHMVQHVVLFLFAAPMIALSRPIETILRGVPAAGRKRLGRLRRATGLTPSTRHRLVRPVTVWLFYGLAIWFWHGAGPYELAASNPGVHLVEHAVFLVVGLGFWSMVLVPGRVSPGFRILMIFTTAFHSVLLGALLTFSDSAWYPSYMESTLALGLDPVADQRLAGLLMWIPGGLVYTGTGLWLLTTWMRTQGDTVSKQLTGGMSRAHN